MSNKSKAAQVAKRIEDSETRAAEIDAEIRKLQAEKVHQSKAIEAATEELRELLSNKDELGKTQLLDLGDGRFCVVTPTPSETTGKVHLGLWFGTPR